MSDTQIFRTEALEYFAKQRGPGRLLQASSRWMDTTYRLFLVLVVVGVLASLLIRIDGVPLVSILVPALNSHG
jgi:hypothetical protein